METQTLELDGGTSFLAPGERIIARARVGVLRAAESRDNPNTVVFDVVVTPPNSKLRGVACTNLAPEDALRLADALQKAAAAADPSIDLEALRTPKDGSHG